MKRKKDLPVEKWSQQLWVELAAKISKLNSRNDVQDILDKLISEDEKATMLRRLATIALIQSGKSYTEIGKMLWLSPNTISTIKKNLLGKHKNYKSYLAFYGGPTKWSSLRAEPEKSYSDAFLELIAVVGKIFEPFMDRGIRILHDPKMYRRPKK